jgi:hypothetical protein
MKFSSSLFVWISDFNPFSIKDEEFKNRVIKCVNEQVQSGRKKRIC